LVGNREWKEPPAVTWRSYDVNKEVGREGVDWIHLAQNEDR